MNTTKLSVTERNRLVSHARELVKLHLEAKWEVCKIALKVCVIKQGGQVHSKEYTLTKFADDIGMNRKTLSCWILEYRSVYLKLGIDSSKMNFDQAKRFSGAIARTRAVLYNFKEGNVEEKVANMSKERVRETFQEIMETDKVTKRLGDFIKNLKHHEYTFTHEKFTKRHEKLLHDYKSKLADISEALEKLI